MEKLESRVSYYVAAPTEIKNVHHQEGNRCVGRVLPSWRNCSIGCCWNGI